MITTDQLGSCVEQANGDVEYRDPWQPGTVVRIHSRKGQTKVTVRIVVNVRTTDPKVIGVIGGKVDVAFAFPEAAWKTLQASRQRRGVKLVAVGDEVEVLIEDVPAKGEARPIFFPDDKAGLERQRNERYADALTHHLGIGGP